jgi:DNA-binding NtrC family response regulator
MRIQFVTDESDRYRSLIVHLNNLDYQCEVVLNREEALRLAKKSRPDVLVMDLDVPSEITLQLLPVLKKQMPGLYVIVAASRSSVRGAVEAMRLGADDYLEKPIKTDDLVLILNGVREKSSLRKGISTEQRDPSGGILCLKTGPMTEVYDYIDQVADKPSVPVAITGETGTGKEHVARLLHARGPNSNGPFVDLHCAALPETLFESELFGFESGSFTGAQQSRAGLFEQAQGGTLFLDEIGELNLGSQMKLLRVLEERKIRRLGSRNQIDLNLRIVVATNRDLEVEVRKGRFRADLYYRLNIFQVRLPTLRERPEDIPALASHFWTQFQQEFCQRLPALSPSILARLQGYRWPGNVRELRNVMGRLVIESSESSVNVEALYRALDDFAAPQPEAVELPLEGKRLVERLNSLRWNRGATAQSLGVSRPTLIKMMKAYGV